MDQSAPADLQIDHAFRRRVVFGLMFFTFIVSMNQLVVAPAMAAMGAQLGDVENMPWVITAYMLTSAIVPPIYGRLGDSHGRRGMLYVALAVFLAGSVLCAVAPTMVTLAIARGIQGLGGGGIVPLLQTALADVMPPRERGRYQAYFSIVFAVSSVTGPLYGGLVAEHFHWSWVFWLNVPLCALAVMMSYRPLSVLPRRRVKHSLDLVGAALLSIMAICLMLALSWGGVKYPWSSPVVLGLAASAAAFCALYIVHSRTTREPLVPLDVLRDRMVGQLAAGTLTGSVIMAGLVTYSPLYFQLVLGVAVGSSGLAVTAIILGGTIGGAIYGRVMSRHENAARLMLIGSLVMSTAAIGALTVFAGDLTPLAAASLLGVVQFGVGATFPAITIQIQNAVVRDHIGIATSTTYFVRAIGSAIGAALLGSIFLAGGHADTIVQINNGVAPAAGDPALIHTFAILFGVAALFVVATLAIFATLERRPLKLTPG